MFGLIPEWIVHILALVVVGRICGPHLVRGLGLHRYRHSVCGGPSDLSPLESSSTYADYYQQLVELGFVPLGIFREEVLWHKGNKEFTFCHPEHDCRAAVYCLAGGDARVALTSDFTDDVLARTLNYDGGNTIADDFVMLREPTNNMRKLLETHLENRDRFLQAGYALRPVETLKDWGQAEARAFFQPIPYRDYLDCERMIAVTFAGTLGILGSIGALGLMKWQENFQEVGYLHALSWSVIALTTVIFLYLKFAISRELDEMSAYQSDCDGAMDGSCAPA